MTTYLIFEPDYNIEISREADPYDGWDRGDSRKDWNFKEVQIGSSKRYDELTSMDFKVGDSITFLIAVYNTSDSFGYDENDCYEVLGIFKTITLAEEMKKRINDDDFTIVTEDGVAENYSGYGIPWKGFFDSLSYTTIETFIIK